MKSKRNILKITPNQILKITKPVTKIDVKKKNTNPYTKPDIKLATRDDIKAHITDKQN